jgi:hypothetical protein
VAEVHSPGDFGEFAYLAVASESLDEIAEGPAGRLRFLLNVGDLISGIRGIAIEKSDLSVEVTPCPCLTLREPTGLALRSGVMPANRMNRDEFYAAIAPHDDARLRRISRAGAAHPRSGDGRDSDRPVLPAQAGNLAELGCIRRDACQAAPECLTSAAGVHAVSTLDEKEDRCVVVVRDG